MISVKIPIPKNLEDVLESVNFDLSLICDSVEARSENIKLAMLSLKRVANEYELREALDGMLPDDADKDSGRWYRILKNLEWLEVPEDAWQIVAGDLQINTDMVVRFYNEQEPLVLPESFVETTQRMNRLCKLLNAFVGDKNCWTITLDIHDYGWKTQTDSMGWALKYEFRPEVWLWYKAVEYNRVNRKQPADAR